MPAPEDSRPTPLEARAHLGVAVRSGDADRIAQARQELALANIDAAVQKFLATAPPLGPSQRARLRDILGGGAA